MKIERECGGKILHDCEQPVKHFFRKNFFIFLLPKTSNLCYNSINEREENKELAMFNRLPFAVVSATKAYTLVFWEGTREECEQWAQTPHAKEVLGRRKWKIIPNPCTY